jgi:probable DNA repair protein
MPHSDAERELTFAQKAASRLFAAASTVILSHPCREGDCELRPSPFISGIAQGEVPTASANDPVTILNRSQPVMEELIDQQGPPLSGTEKVYGGTSILKDQALCPFRAFARHRLAAKALECVDIGLDAGIRGTLLHASLEYFWRLTRSHQVLCALAEGELRQRIKDCVELAIGSHFERKSFKPSERLLKIEQKRLSELILEWVGEFERTRHPFTVEELEKTHRETFGGLVIDTKVDRIDRFVDGSRAILDYKTGRPDLADLLDERLLEPQLPVYGVGDGGESLASVAFAMVRRGECSFKGVARKKGMLPRVEGFSASKEAVRHGIADWEGLLERWRVQLEELGREFVCGLAAIDPVDPKKACDHCDLASLCRIHEIREIREEDE